MNEQTTVNTDSIKNLVAKGEVENVQRPNEQTDKVEQTVEQSK